eukprot:scaffold14577_cov118-Cylindrotheca_fusiformis.AAC.2
MAGKKDISALVTISGHGEKEKRIKKEISLDMTLASKPEGDGSTAGSNAGMSQFDDSIGADSPEPVKYVAPAVAQREEKAVTRSKFLFFFVLVLAVSGAATATYLLMESQEYNDFRAGFAGLGSEVSTVAGQKVDQMFNALDAYSLYISAQVEEDLDSNWPFAPISKFSIKTEKIAELIGLEKPDILLCPIVQEEDRDEWPSFVSEWTPEYYKESIENEGEKHFTFDEMMNMTVPYIWSYGEFDGVSVPAVKIERPGPTLPLFYMYPLEHPFVGMMARSLDMLGFVETANQFQVTSLILRPSLSFAFMVDSREGADPDEAVVGSQIMQPVIEDGNLVGVVLLRFQWYEFFENLNIDGLTGTIGVLRSSCNIGYGTDIDDETRNEISYSIDKSGSEFLGMLDAHNPKYDDLVVSRVVVNIDVDEGQLPDGVCIPKVTLDLYPTEELENTYRSSIPEVYTAVVVAIFAFTSLVFLLYDHFVGRRQRKFIDRIVRQDQIVSNEGETAQEEPH